MRKPHRLPWAKVSTRKKSSRTQCGFAHCKHCCMVCIHSEQSSSHKCQQTGQEWKITAPINCQTKNVVYKLSCRKCQDFVYIGETRRRFCDRVQEHRGYITQKKLNHPVGSHFNERGHSVADLQPLAIERVLPRDDHLLRRRRERLWINKYDAIDFGANRTDKFLSNFC